jgi:SIT4-associating protein SAP185/190
MSAVDEGRRLEIMNSSADDDGFEEVSHGADEENSHGVLELPDAPTHPPVSMLLDNDDFVDEPLSSPKLKLHETEGNQTLQQPPFEDADLVVAPLSPSKKAAQTLGSDEAKKDAPVGEATQDASSLQTQSDIPDSQQKQQVPESGESHSEEQTSDSTSAAALQTPSNTGQLPTEPVEDKLPPHEGMSPRPEDTPSPLFSGPNPPAPSPATPAEVVESDASPSQGQVTGSQESSKPTLEPAQPGTSATLAAAESGDISIVVADVSEAANPVDEASANSRTVVGDYLKMQLVEHRVVPTILGFFFRYPWNNFLHNVVYDIVQQVFNGPMDRGYNPTLAISLFEAADITNQIINGQLKSEKSQAENKTRMGYMGHLTLIAEEVVKFTERHPPELISELVLEKVMAQDWISYVEGALAETRERDNAILGGVRPEVAMSNRANAQGLMGSNFSGLSSIGLGGGGGSNALAEAGLNGGSDVAEGSGGSGIGPFAISAGTLMSGFGSSSDEDDDEEPESEEDVNNEVGDSDSFDDDDWLPNYDSAGPSGAPSLPKPGPVMDEEEPEVEYVESARSEPEAGTQPTRP